MSLRDFFAVEEARYGIPIGTSMSAVLSAATVNLGTFG
jgi:hypothetical protein